MPTSQEEGRRVTTAAAEGTIPTQTTMHPPDPTYKQSIITTTCQKRRLMRQTVSVEEPIPTSTATNSHNSDLATSTTIKSSRCKRPIRNVEDTIPTPTVKPTDHIEHNTR
jgi:hypothetical protein